MMPVANAVADNTLSTTVNIIDAIVSVPELIANQTKSAQNPIRNKPTIGSGSAFFTTADICYAGTYYLPVFILPILIPC